MHVEGTAGRFQKLACLLRCKHTSGVRALFSDSISTFFLAPEYFHETLKYIHPVLRNSFLKTCEGERHRLQYIKSVVYEIEGTIYALVVKIPALR
jgi:hypothetical protein